MKQSHDKELDQLIAGKTQSEFISGLVIAIEKQELENKTSAQVIDALKQLNNRSKILVHRARIDIDERKVTLDEKKFEKQCKEDGKEN